MSFKENISKQTINTTLHVYPSQVRSNINETLDKILSKRWKDTVMKMDIF